MIKRGDTVLCRYFDTPNGKFYGSTFEAIILDIEKNTRGERIFRVMKDRGIVTDLKRKEIKRILERY